MRVLSDQWVADNWCNLNLGEENNHDFGKEVIPKPNFDDNVNDQVIDTLSDEHIAQVIFTMDEEMKPHDTIVKDDKNITSDEHQIGSANSSEDLKVELVYVEKISDSDNITDCEKLAIEINIAKLEQIYAENFIDTSVMELWVAELYEKYSNVFDALLD